MKNAGYIVLFIIVLLSPLALVMPFELLGKVLLTVLCILLWPTALLGIVCLMGDK